VPHAPAPPPAPDSAPAGSPDKGTGTNRVTPGSDKPATPAAPTVRPDNETQKTPTPAKAGGK
jgi:hypothetical protein